MKKLRPSLLWKLILGIWVVSIAGIIIIVLIAGSVTRQEFGRFVSDSQHTNVTDELMDYYIANGTWQGAEVILSEEARHFPSNGGSLQVVDDQNVVVASTISEEVGTTIADTGTEGGMPIIVGDTLVGRLIANWPPINPNEVAAPNISRMNLGLLISAISLTVLALLAGLAIARTITKPVRVLNEATHAITRGDLDKDIHVSTQDEIGELAKSFEAMRLSLKRSRDLRRQMTADIAHELRNPLSIILGNAEAMSEGVLPADPATLRIIYDEAKHLSGLVEDLRTLSLSEAGELCLHVVSLDLKSELEHCALIFKTQADTHKITLVVDAPTGLPEVEFDKERMQQVFSNLIDNSIKYGRPKSKVRLTARVISGWAVITIEDEGQGIPADELPHIFDRFYRGKRSRDVVWQGSGLGLAISKALVELHNGHIQVDSRVGKGTCFTISLPVKSQAMEDCLDTP